MSYSAKDELLSVTNQLGRITTYAYDQVSNLASRVFPTGFLAVYGYDPLSRLTTITYTGGTDGTTVVQAYDPTGNRLSMIDSVGTTTFAYDANSRIIGRTEPGALVQSYGYDLADQRTTLNEPGNILRTYGYDLDGRLTTYTNTNFSTTMSFDKMGREIQSLSPSGILRNTVYDLAGQLRSLIDISSANAVIQGFTYSYDPDGNRLASTDNAGIANVQYVYDAKDRLITEITTGLAFGTVNYKYDPTDNLVQNGLTFFTVNGMGQIVTSAYMAQSTVFAISTYQYDVNGNLSSIQDPNQTVAMLYDVENRMNSHNQLSGTGYYRYNADGKKLVENVENGLTTLVWDSEDYLQQQTTPVNNASAFMGQTVPFSVTHGSLFVATLIFGNVGVSNWTVANNYQVESVTQPFWGVTSFNIPSSVNPSQVGTFTTTFTAPSTAGLYSFQWSMSEAGGYFGELSDLALIEVV